MRLSSAVRILRRPRNADCLDAFDLMKRVVAEAATLATYPRAGNVSKRIWNAALAITGASGGDVYDVCREILEDDANALG